MNVDEGSVMVVCIFSKSAVYWAAAVVEIMGDDLNSFGLHGVVSHLSPFLIHLLELSSRYVELWKVLTSKVCGVDLGVGIDSACGRGGVRHLCLDRRCLLSYSSRLM